VAEVEENDLLMEVSYISNDFQLYLTFTEPLLKSSLLSSSQRFSLNREDIQFWFKGSLLEWSMLSTTSSLGSYLDNDAIQIKF